MKKVIKSTVAFVLALAMVLTALPAQQAYAAVKKVTVSSQKELNKALKGKATQITIKTSKKVKITIPEGEYSKKIVVNAKNAEIVNKAEVKSISVQNAGKYTEKADGNKITVTDSKLTITVSSGYSDTKITVNKTNSKVTVVANGDVASVTVSKKSSVVVKGSTDSAVKITNNAADSSIKTSVTANVVANEPTSLNVSGAGAAGTTVTASADIDMKVSEKASVAAVTVKADSVQVNIDAKGKVEKVDVNAAADVLVSGSAKDVVVVNVNAEGATVTAETAVSVNNAASDTKVTIKDGAEGSEVVAVTENAKTEVSNETKTDVVVKDTAGNETKVEAGGEQEVTKDDIKPAAPTTPDTPSTPSTPSTPGTPSTPSTPDTPVNPPAQETVYKEVSGWTNPTITVSVTSGASAVVAAINAQYGKVNVAGTKSETAEAAVTWTAPNGWPTEGALTAGDYTFTGKITLPTGWTGTPADLTVTVTVTGETEPDVPDTLDKLVTVSQINLEGAGFTASGEGESKTYTVTSDGFTYTFHNETSDGTSTTADSAYNLNNITVSQDDKKQTCTITVKNDATLKSFASSNSAQGEGAWIALDVDLGVTGDEYKNIKWNNTNLTEQDIDDLSQALAVIDAADDTVHMVWWVKVTNDGAELTRTLSREVDGKTESVTIKVVMPESNQS